jgi:selenocysteine lyase/cysteine desulfurase
MLLKFAGNKYLKRTKFNYMPRSIRNHCLKETEEVISVVVDINHAINREDFPILSIEAYPGKNLIYLDSAASSQKPLFVLNKMDEVISQTFLNSSPPP